LPGETASAVGTYAWQNCITLIIPPVRVCDSGVAAGEIWLNVVVVPTPSPTPSPTPAPTEAPTAAPTPTLCEGDGATSGALGKRRPNATGTCTGGGGSPSPSPPSSSPTPLLEIVDASKTLVSDGKVHNEVDGAKVAFTAQYVNPPSAATGCNWNPSATPFVVKSYEASTSSASYAALGASDVSNVASVSYY
jgi:hypothetical protein